ncbi:MAG: hypothetical protein AB7T22_13750 [Calditrichaceae bacterium]
MKKIFIMVVFLFVIVMNVFSQTVPLRIMSSTDDWIGDRLVAEISKKVYGPGKLFHAADKDDASIGLRIITVKIPSIDGPAVTYGLAFTLNGPGEPFPYYVEHQVGICGANRIDATAELIAKDAWRAVVEITKKKEEIVK